MPLGRPQTTPLAVRRPPRRGAVLVELAICLPVILIIVLGAIEATEVIYLQQTLELSSYEGTRLAIRKGLPGPNSRYERPLTNADVRSRAEAILSARSVNGATINISVPDVAAVPSGDPLTVTVTAPTNGNAVRLLGFSAGRVLTATTTMMKDFRQLPLLTPPPLPPPPPPPVGDD